MRTGARSGDAVTGWVAVALGVVIVATFAALLLFFVAGGSLGLINDAGNALIGILSAVLAILLQRRLGTWVAVIAAVIGAAVAVWGSWLVMTATTGFLLAGFVSSIGLGLIGAWLAMVAWSPMAEEWSSGLRRLARIAAAFMVVGGVAAVPGALMGMDDFEAVPPWLWLLSLAWIGAYVLYPAWAVSFGRRLTSG